MNIEEVRNQLRDKISTVTFKKKNGDIRVMECTTSAKFIPPSQWPQGKINLSEETLNSVIRVYDTRAQGWRSMILENIISIT